MTPLLLASTLALGATVQAGPEDDVPTVQAVLVIEAFGSRQVDGGELVGKLSAPLQAFLKASKRGDETGAGAIRELLENRIRRMGDFAYVGFTLSQAVEAGGAQGEYLCLDLVDAADAAERMPFRKPPEGKPEDPEGLLAGWATYENLGWFLVDSGNVDPAKARCPGAQHCVFGFEAKDLQPFGPFFANYVPPNKAALERVLLEDADAQRRAAAAFLLAHQADPSDVARSVAPGVYDPDASVRSNVLRVLAHVAQTSPDAEIPLEPVAAAVRFPAPGDRAKAAAILAARPGLEEHAAGLLPRLGPTLAAMMDLKQPGSRDSAYRVLRRLHPKGPAYGDLPGWKAWAKGLEKAGEKK